MLPQSFFMKKNNKKRKGEINDKDERTIDYGYIDSAISTRDYINNNNESSIFTQFTNTINNILKIKNAPKFYKKYGENDIFYLKNILLQISNSLNISKTNAINKWTEIMFDEISLDTSSID